MPENRHLRFLLKLLYLVLGAAGLFLCLRYLLPWLLPFLIALGLAALLEPAVRFFTQKLHMPRWAGSALCTLLLTALLVLLMGLLVWRVWYELSLLLGRLPTLLAGLPTLGHRMEDWFYRFLIALPVQFQEIAREAVDNLIAQGISLPNRFYDWLAGTVTATVTFLPSAGLFLFTTALATYFTSAARPSLLAFFALQIPAGWKENLKTGAQSLRGALGGWLKAQGMLMLITFLELTIGFFVLRVDLALLLAAAVALVDALPVFGTGTVLLPWALLALLGGDGKLALGLLLLYAAITLVRNVLEPKLVGDRIGLPPLAALLAMYLGFSMFGVVGMIIAPLGAILLKQLHDCGLIHLWKHA